MKKTAFWQWSLVLIAGLLLQACGGGKDGSAWPPVNGAQPANDTQFVTGVSNIEQLVRIDGTSWAVGSSNPGGAGVGAPLYFVNLDTKIATPLDPTKVTMAEDKAAYPGCPKAPTLSKMRSLGLDFEQVRGRSLLTAIDHGDGYSIQVFEVKISDASLPALTWVGCVMPPDGHFWPDAVASLPDGGMLVTSLFDPLDVDFVNSLGSGKPYGRLGEWHAGTGWSDIHPSTFAGPNGIILSTDYRTMAVANWSGHRVSLIDRTTNRVINVDFPGLLVDNLTWNESGTKILVGGQNTTIAKAFECNGGAAVNCEVHFAIYELDPKTLARRALVGPNAQLGVMGAGTGALQYGETLWITAFRADRIAYIKYPW